MNKVGIIYKATNIISDKSYIGQTIGKLDTRISNHYKDSKTYTYAFANALRKYKREDWGWEILYYDIPQKQLNNMEEWYVACYNTYYKGYNSITGGDSNPSTDPLIAQKISRSNKGKKQSKETVEKRVSQFRGKKHTEESKRRMSEAQKNRKLSEVGLSNIIEAQAKTYKIIKPNGDIEIIKNLNKYCRENNLSSKNMSSVACGKRKHHKGYICERVEG